MTCGCGKTLEVKDSLRGKKIRCPSCESVMKVPDETPGDAGMDTGNEEESTSEGTGLELGEVTEGPSQADLEPGKDDESGSASSTQPPPRQETEEPESADQQQTDQTCPNCGTELLKGDIYCLECGTDVRTGEKVADDDADADYLRKKWTKRSVVAVVVLAVGIWGYLQLQSWMNQKAPGEAAKEKLTKAFAGSGTPSMKDIGGYVRTAEKSAVKPLKDVIMKEDTSPERMKRAMEGLMIAGHRGHVTANNLRELHARLNRVDHFAVLDALSSLHVVLGIRVFPLHMQKTIREIDLEQPAPADTPSPSSKVKQVISELVEDSGRREHLRLAGLVALYQMFGNTSDVQKKVEFYDFHTPNSEEHLSYYRRFWYRITGRWFSSGREIRSWYQKNSNNSRTRWLVTAFNRVPESGEDGGGNPPDRQTHYAYLHHQLRMLTGENIGTYASPGEFKKNWISEWEKVLESK